MQKKSGLIDSDTESEPAPARTRTCTPSPEREREPVSLPGATSPPEQDARRDFMDAVLACLDDEQSREELLVNACKTGDAEVKLVVFFLPLLTILLYSSSH